MSKKLNVIKIMIGDDYLQTYPYDGNTDIEELKKYEVKKCTLESLNEYFSDKENYADYLMGFTLEIDFVIYTKDMREFKKEEEQEEEQEEENEENSSDWSDSIWGKNIDKIKLTRKI